jgi:hypothetical protein
MRVSAVFLLLAACGGAAGKPTPVISNPTPTSSPPQVVVAAAPKQTPAPFKGSFEVVRASDGNATMVFADVFRRGALDGRMLWTIDGDAFSVEMWQITNPRPAEGGDLYALCRASATIVGRWQGNSVVLPSKLRAKGWSTSLLFSKKTNGTKSSKRTWEQSAECGVSLDNASPITFEIVEKDAEGPVRLRATTDKATFELQRGTSVEALDPKAVLDVLTR